MFYNKVRKTREGVTQPSRQGELQGCLQEKI